MGLFEKYAPFVKKSRKNYFIPCVRMETWGADLEKNERLMFKGYECRRMFRKGYIPAYMPDDEFYLTRRMLCELDGYICSKMWKYKDGRKSEEIKMYERYKSAHSALLRLIPDIYPAVHKGRLYEHMQENRKDREDEISKITEFLKEEDDICAQGKCIQYADE